MSKRKRYAAEGIVNKLREADVLLSKGQSVAQTCKQIGIADQTYYRWRRSYGGLIRKPRCGWTFRFLMR
jgi:transposase-like protein